MALSFKMTPHQPPRSVGVYSGLNPQCSGLLGAGRTTATVSFLESVRKSLHCSCKATRTGVTMMSIMVPRKRVKHPISQRPEWVDLRNALYRERIIYIGKEIDEHYSNELLATMLYLDSNDNQKRMLMYITGDGGDLSPCLQIYDAMKNLKSPIHTICPGYANNMAAFLFAAGEKGKRMATAGTTISIEPPVTSAEGKADAVLREAQELIRIKDYLYNELAKFTGQPFEKIDKDFKMRKKFNAVEAIEYGIVDAIIRPPKLGDEIRRRGRRNLSD